MSAGTFLVLLGLLLAIVDIAVGFAKRTWPGRWILAVAVILVALGILIGAEPFIST